MKKIYIFILFILSMMFIVGCIRDVPPNKACCSDLKYEDLRFPVNELKIQGVSNIPKWVSFINNTYVLGFSPSTEEQVFVEVQFPHARVANSTIYPHFHWTYEEPKATGTVVWCMEYTCANVGDIFGYTEIKCVNDTAREPYEHHMTDMITINNTLESSGMCSMRLFRDATSPYDTFPVGAFLLEFDIHYQTYFYGDKLD